MNIGIAMVRTCAAFGIPSFALVAGLLCGSTVSLCGADKKKSNTPKPKKADLSDYLFATNSPIRTFKIDIVSNELAALQRDNRAYVRGTVTEGNTVFGNVGLHLKGNGSFQQLNQKPSFAVKFDKFVPDQEY